MQLRERAIRLLIYLIISASLSVVHKCSVVSFKLSYVYYTKNK